MLKVLKFGGSSLADARQFAKVKSIVEADPARRVVIVSAPGKRFSGDHKITDLLYLCAAHIKYGVSCEDIFAMIRDRYNEIIAECGLHISLEKERGNKAFSDEKTKKGERTASSEMCDFLIINISSLQIIPVNIIAYRSQYGSVNPAQIVGPALIATTCSTLTAIIFCKIRQNIYKI